MTTNSETTPVTGPRQSLSIRIRFQPEVSRECGWALPTMLARWRENPSFAETVVTSNVFMRRLTQAINLPISAARWARLARKCAIGKERIFLAVLFRWEEGATVAGWSSAADVGLPLKGHVYLKAAVRIIFADCRRAEPFRRLTMDYRHQRVLSFVVCIVVLAAFP